MTSIFPSSSSRPSASASTAANPLHVMASLARRSSSAAQQAQPYYHQQQHPHMHSHGNGGSSSRHLPPRPSMHSLGRRHSSVGDGQSEVGHSMSPSSTGTLLSASSLVAGLNHSRGNSAEQHQQQQRPPHPSHQTQPASATVAMAPPRQALAQVSLVRMANVMNTATTATVAKAPKTSAGSKTRWNTASSSTAPAASLGPLSSLPLPPSSPQGNTPLLPFVIGHHTYLDEAEAIAHNGVAEMFAPNRRGGRGGGGGGGGGGHRHWMNHHVDDNHQQNHCFSGSLQRSGGGVVDASLSYRREEPFSLHLDPDAAALRERRRAEMEVQREEQQMEEEVEDERGVARALLGGGVHRSAMDDSVDGEAPPMPLQRPPPSATPSPSQHSPRPHQQIQRQHHSPPPAHVAVGRAESLSDSPAMKGFASPTRSPSVNSTTMRGGGGGGHMALSSSSSSAAAAVSPHPTDAASVGLNTLVALMVRRERDEAMLRLRKAETEEGEAQSSRARKKATSNTDDKMGEGLNKPAGPEPSQVPAEPSTAKNATNSAAAAVVSALSLLLRRAGGQRRSGLTTRPPPSSLSRGRSQSQQQRMRRAVSRQRERQRREEGEDARRSQSAGARLQLTLPRRKDQQQIIVQSPGQHLTGTTPPPRIIFRECVAAQTTAPYVDPSDYDAMDAALRVVIGENHRLDAGAAVAEALYSERVEEVRRCYGEASEQLKAVTAMVCDAMTRRQMEMVATTVGNHPTQHWMDGEGVNSTHTPQRNTRNSGSGEGASPSRHTTSIGVNTSLPFVQSAALLTAASTASVGTSPLRSLFPLPADVTHITTPTTTTASVSSMTDVDGAAMSALLLAAEEKNGERAAAEKEAAEAQRQQQAREDALRRELSLQYQLATQAKQLQMEEAIAALEQSHSRALAAAEATHQQLLDRRIAEAREEAERSAGRGHAQQLADAEAAVRSVAAVEHAAAVEKLTRRHEAQLASVVKEHESVVGSLEEHTAQQTALIARLQGYLEQYKRGEAALIVAWEAKLKAALDDATTEREAMAATHDRQLSEMALGHSTRLEAEREKFAAATSRIRSAAETDVAEGFLKLHVEPMALRVMDAIGVDEFFTNRSAIISEWFEGHLEFSLEFRELSHLAVLEAMLVDHKEEKEHLVAHYEREKGRLCTQFEKDVALIEASHGAEMLRQQEAAALAHSKALTAALDAMAARHEEELLALRKGSATNSSNKSNNALDDSRVKAEQFVRDARSALLMGGGGDADVENGASHHYRHLHGTDSIHNNSSSMARRVEQQALRSAHDAEVARLEGHITALMKHNGPVAAGMATPKANAAEAAKRAVGRGGGGGVTTLYSPSPARGDRPAAPKGGPAALMAGGFMSPIHHSGNVRSSPSSSSSPRQQLRGSVSSGRRDQHPHQNAIAQIVGRSSNALAALDNDDPSMAVMGTPALLLQVAAEGEEASPMPTTIYPYADGARSSGGRVSSVDPDAMLTRWSSSPEGAPMVAGGDRGNRSTIGRRSGTTHRHEFVSPPMPSMHSPLLDEHHQYAHDGVPLSSLSPRGGDDGATAREVVYSAPRQSHHAMAPSSSSSPPHLTHGGSSPLPTAMMMASAYTSPLDSNTSAKKGVSAETVIAPAAGLVTPQPSIVVPNTGRSGGGGGESSFGGTVTRRVILSPRTAERRLHEQDQGEGAGGRGGDHVFATPMHRGQHIATSTPPSSSAQRHFTTPSAASPAATSTAARGLASPHLADPFPSARRDRSSRRREAMMVGAERTTGEGQEADEVVLMSNMPSVAATPAAAVRGIAYNDSGDGHGGYAARDALPSGASPLADRQYQYIQQRQYIDNGSASPPLSDVSSAWSVPPTAENSPLPPASSVSVGRTSAARGSSSNARHQTVSPSTAAGDGDDDEDGAMVASSPSMSPPSHQQVRSLLAYLAR